MNFSPYSIKFSFSELYWTKVVHANPAFWIKLGSVHRDRITRTRIT